MLNGVGFWGRVDRTAAGCWPWLGAHQNLGYGVVSIDGRMHYAHRVAYALANGVIAGGKLICHHCDVRDCCRPSHLFEGSHRDNTADMHAKGRAANDVTAAHAAWKAKPLCAHGHERTNENSYIRKDGSRFCRVCHLDRIRRRRNAI